MKTNTKATLLSLFVITLTLLAATLGVIIDKVSANISLDWLNNPWLIFVAIPLLAVIQYTIPKLQGQNLKPEDQIQVKSSDITTNARYRSVFLARVRSFWTDTLQSDINPAIPEPTITYHVGVEVHRERSSKSEYINISNQDQAIEHARTLLLDGSNIILVIGERGSGKTTFLRKVALSVLQRAEEDDFQRMPVILNMASWEQKRSNLAAWILEQLYETYGVSSSVATEWISNERLILLLDGLDQISLRSVLSCIGEIDSFRRNHGFTPIAITASTDVAKDFEHLRSRAHTFVVNPIDVLSNQDFLSYFGIYMEYNEEAKSQLRDSVFSTPLMLDLCHAIRSLSNLDQIDLSAR